MPSGRFPMSKFARAVKFQTLFMVCEVGEKHLKEVHLILVCYKNWSSEEVRQTDLVL